MILSGNTNATTTRSARLSTKITGAVVQDENKLSTKVAADKKAGVVKQRSILGDISNKLTSKSVKAEKPVCDNLSTTLDKLLASALC
jgi:hypothetical protein